MKKKVLMMTIAITSIGVMLGCDAGRISSVNPGNESVKIEEGSDIQADTEASRDIKGEAESVDTTNDNSEAKENMTEAEKEGQFEKIENNNGNYVKCGNKIFYHKPVKEALDATSITFPYLIGCTAESVLCEYDVTTKAVKELCTDNPSGKLSISNGYLYIDQNADSEGNGEYSVKVISIDGKNEATMPDEILEGASEDGTYVATMKYADGKAMMCIYTGNTKISEYDIERFSEFITITNDKVVYLALTDKSDIYDYEVRSFDINTGEIITLGELGTNDNGTPYSSACQKYSDGNVVYFSTGAYEGTGHFFAGGKWICVDITKADSLTAMEVSSPPENGEPTAFVVENEQMKEAEGIPMTAKVAYEPDYGKLFIYDEAGKGTAIAEGYETVYNDETDTMVTVDTAECMGDYVVLTKLNLTHVPSDDIGWRYAYKRDNVSIYVYNIKTQEMEQIDNVGR